MDPHSRPHRRTAIAPAAPAAPAGPHHHPEQQTKQAADPLLALSKPAGYIVHLVAAQLEHISASLLSLSSPFLSLLSESEAVPSRVAHGGGTLVRRLSLGLLGAVHAIAVLVAALAAAVLIGVGLVRFWVEEPVVYRQALHFDYTNAEPTAVVLFGGAGAPKGRAIPAGHTTRVCLELLMPESDYNQHIGVFQVTAEVIASNGVTISSSSQPCMLRFRSLPVRLVRTFIMGIPLLVGMSSETQKLVLEILRYKESNQEPTGGIRVRLKPRAGTFYLPQIYEAEIRMNSQLPRRKEIVYNWKWTFYVWISLYVYIMLLIVLACCFKPFSSPRRGGQQADHWPIEAGKEERSTKHGEISEEFSDALRRWKERSRSKRKVRFPQVQVSELIEGSASSVTGEGETSEVIEDSGDFAASESSECVGG